ncbi:MAG: 16S rRNA processing protein RimM [Parasporobacterium sp.]|nr:16S rRNA processing protein RimM [Parasporobacterium sp.]
MEQFLRIGVLTRAHGVHGEAKVFPTTDYPERFEEVSEVIIKTRKGDIRTGIDGVKYFKNMAIVKFSCFSNPEEIQGLAGSDIMIDRSQAQPLEDGEYYIADLIGCSVYADDESGELSGRTLGVLKDVLQTAANDVYIVQTPSGKELLFPVIGDCIKDVDIENSRITVHVMKGLLD